MRTQPTPVRVGFVALGLLVCSVGLAGCADNPTPPTPPKPTRPPVALAPVEVTGVGDVAQGGASEPDLVLQFTEISPASIAPGPGTFQVTLTDHLGLRETVSFTGTPSVSGPGSLGATATLTAGNVLTVGIVDSDTVNIEQMTITGLGISTAPTAALGSINAIIGPCAGSMAGCTATNVLASPGNVVAAP